MKKKNLSKNYKINRMKKKNPKNLVVQFWWLVIESYLASPYVDGEVNELRVFLHKVLDCILLQEVMSLLLQVKTTHKKRP